MYKTCIAKMFAFICNLYQCMGLLNIKLCTI